ncbi:MULTISPECIES: transposase [unclassified Aeromicrobium]|uniref:transposase n=1 Tax=unclassified Aeromicrobium TaxID=2633570 RepID=UPI00288BC53D|nr:MULTISPECIES: transposase [unclassified Aeromicrobium]
MRVEAKRFDMTMQYVRRSGVGADVEARVRSGVGGRPRDLEIDVLLAAIILVPQDLNKVHHTKLHRLLTTGLSRTLQKTLNIRSGSHVLSLRQVRYLHNTITDTYETSDAVKPVLMATERAARREAGMDVDNVTSLTPAEQAERQAALADFQRKILAASTTHIGRGTRLAIDATALDSAARGKVRGLRCADPDARWGPRTKAYDNRTKKVFDFHATMGIRTGTVGGVEEPALVETFFLLPANKKGIEETVAELAYANGLPGGVDEIMVDRAYSYSVAPKWADKLREFCIEQVFDLHPNDHGAKLNVKDGCLMIDGWAHCPSTPNRLKRIARPQTFSPLKLRRNATSKEHADRDRQVADLERFNAEIAERDQYKFEKHGTTSSGKTRFKCPARAGKLLCEGCPLSTMLPGDRPAVEPEDLENLPRACAQETITIDPSAAPKLNQKHYWGSKAWQADYGRRSRAEGTFGFIKTEQNVSTRGWTRQVGLVKTAFNGILVVAAYNLTTLLRWAKVCGDTRDPLTLIDLTDHGFEELDVSGNVIGGVPPPVPV